MSTSNQSCISIFKIEILKRVSEILDSRDNEPPGSKVRSYLSGKIDGLLDAAKMIDNTTGEKNDHVSNT